LLLIITIYLGLVTTLWAIQSLRAAVGMNRLPHVERFAPLAKDRCPRISIIFAARDEAEKLPGALATLLALDYPDYEVVAVDDRSSDATGRILDDFASRDTRLRVLHVTSLPPGWLGKPHALHLGQQASTADWLIFTDADVHFAPDLLGRGMAIALQQELDHLSLFAKMEMKGFWERVAMTYFAMGFAIGQEAWRTIDPRSSTYIGIGAFQLIRRSAYESVGGHRRLAMEVVDDMKLGKLVKRGGFRSQVGIALRHLSVRWHSGLGNIIRGTTKNFYAVSGYRLWYASLQVIGTLILSVLPWISLAWLVLSPGHGLWYWFALLAAAGAVAVPLLVHAATAVVSECSPLYALTHPLGALILSWMLIRSTAVTLWQGGIVWRDTFYPLEELRRGLV
jgi:glycosyltransferase involved in cell wall biosynthesis